MNARVVFESWQNSKVELSPLNSMPRTRISVSKKKDTESFGPLGNLIRNHRNQLRLSLAQVAQACSCSVQFISNIEHGRAPLPWDKAKALADVLQIDLTQLESANLSIRSDLKGYLANQKVKSSVTPSGLAVALKDRQIQKVLEKYQGASDLSKKRFVETALKILSTI